jgi:hypothetical protein
VTTGGAPPAGLADVASRTQIETVLNSYCLAYEHLDVAEVQRLFPAVPFKKLRRAFREYDSLQCSLAGPADYIGVNDASGKAVVKVRVNWRYDMKVGGVQKQRTIMTAVLSRSNPANGWSIDMVNHRRT